MLRQYTALSIVAPNAERIVQGLKTLEVRSWQPEKLPLKDVVIVENQNFLLNEGDEEMGHAIALVDIESIHLWQSDEVSAACASYWAEGILLGLFQMSVLLRSLLMLWQNGNSIKLNYKKRQKYE